MTNRNISPAEPGGALEQPPPSNTAVLFLIFNRPDTTAIVFEAIRAARPARLYVAADGARTSRQAETQKCIETRAIIKKVDWPCEVKTLFRDENLGCKRAVSGAIDWFFEHESQGIILEDDCVPDISFFGFCEHLLLRYAEDERIGQIAGTSFVDATAAPTPDASYRYSRHFSIWGWATWRRAWKSYDSDLSAWPQFDCDRYMNTAYPLPKEREARRVQNRAIVNGRIDTWDYQWVFANAAQSRLSIVPSQNLVVNIGFGAEATHTHFRHTIAPTLCYQTELPPRHPQFVVADNVYDTVLSKRLYPGWLIAKLGSLAARLKDVNYLRTLVSRTSASVQKAR
ncbi:hypothetical protein [Nevskia sp.]|uniref:hypothetical protein n=1 Tax=Nevskia sp. TaxID=1929292 RepID=UPI0025E0DFC1|nr:hypothetical protein [Nevskia sp.]